MLDHLTHIEATNSADALTILKADESFDWIVFHIPAEKTEKGTKNAMYKRMWKIRAEGFDAMVRQLDNEYILVCRKEVT